MRHIESKAEFYRLSRALLLGNRLRQWTWDEYVVLYLEGERLPLEIGVRHLNGAFVSTRMANGNAYLFGLDFPDRSALMFDESVNDRWITIQGEVCATERGLYLRYSTLQCHQRVLWHIDTNGLTGLRREQYPKNLGAYYVGKYCDCRRPVRHAWGLEASGLLKAYMDAPSWDMLNEILGCQLGEEGTGDLNFTYPIVEFTCFDRAVGVLGWNTLFWEVRTKY